jgi:hypothetical protein
MPEGRALQKYSLIPFCVSRICRDVAQQTVSDWIVNTSTDITYDNSVPQVNGTEFRWTREAVAA